MFFWSVSVSQPNSLEAQIIFEKDRFHFSSDASTEGRDSEAESRWKEIPSEAKSDIRGSPNEAV